VRSRSAALLRLPSSATARKVRNCLRSIGCLKCLFPQASYADFCPCSKGPRPAIGRRFAATGRPAMTAGESYLTHRYQLRWPNRLPRCVVRLRLPLHRGGPRRATRWFIDRLQIRGECPGRTCTGRVVLLQEQEQCEAEAALGKTSGAVVAFRATVFEQSCGRLALIEILRLRHVTGQHGNGAERKQTAPHALQRDKLKSQIHAPVAPRSSAARNVSANVGCS